MTLNSAFDDLVATTLAAISGVLGRLDYVAGLRGASGESYSHWGFARLYGEDAAQAALEAAHRLMFLRLLRTPMRTLVRDVGLRSEELGLPPAAYAEDLYKRGPVLLPRDLGGGSVRHFNSVLRALSTLASNPSRNPPGATRRA